MKIWLAWTEIKYTADRKEQRAIEDVCAKRYYVHVCTCVDDFACVCMCVYGCMHVAMVTSSEPLIRTLRHYRWCTELLLIIAVRVPHRWWWRKEYDDDNNSNRTVVLGGGKECGGE